MCVERERERERERGRERGRERDIRKKERKKIWFSRRRSKYPLAVSIVI